MCFSRHSRIYHRLQSLLYNRRHAINHTPIQSPVSEDDQRAFERPAGAVGVIGLRLVFHSFDIFLTSIKVLDSNRAYA